MTRTEVVAALPRRSAHAGHALLACVADLHGPVTAAEVVLFDVEALSARSTAAGLRGLGRDYCFCVDGIWCPLSALYDLREPLEDRFLRETAEE